MFVRPRRLRPGDSVAVLSPSWGGPHVFPEVFDAGVETLRRLGLVVREMPTTRMSPAALRADPQARGADLNEAFADPSIAAVVASIGGDDSARLLRFLDDDTMRDNPKILMGFSDASTLLVFVHRLGMVTFNGPTVMAGLAQLRHFPAAEAHLRSILFEPTGAYRYEPFPEWVDAYPDWSSTPDATAVGDRHRHDGWHWIGGARARAGRLFGGSAETLEVLKGSTHWPAAPFWSDRILFLETSELVPTVEQVRSWLLGYGIQGVFDRASALLVGRARGYRADAKAELDRMIVDTVVGEFGAGDLPIVTNMDFGHTDPQWILPLGVMAEVDPVTKAFRLLEPAVT